MATYEYVCRDCGDRFDIRAPIGTAPDRHHCPTCSGSARRAFSAPAFNGLATPTRQLLEREEKSRDEPDVVRHIPPRAHSPRTKETNPALARLPRP